MKFRFVLVALLLSLFFSGISLAQDNGDELTVESESSTVSNKLSLNNTFKSAPLERDHLYFNAHAEVNPGKTPFLSLSLTRNMSFLTLVSLYDDRTLLWLEGVEVMNGFDITSLDGSAGNLKGRGGSYGPYYATTLTVEEYAAFLEEVLASNIFEYHGEKNKFGLLVHFPEITSSIILDGKVLRMNYQFNFEHGEMIYAGEPGIDTSIYYADHHKRGKGQELIPEQLFDKMTQPQREHWQAHVYMKKMILGLIPEDESRHHLVGMLAERNQQSLIKRANEGPRMADVRRMVAEEVVRKNEEEQGEETTNDLSANTKMMLEMLDPSISILHQRKRKGIRGPESYGPPLAKIIEAGVKYGRSTVFLYKDGTIIWRDDYNDYQFDEKGIRPYTTKNPDADYKDWELEYHGYKVGEVDSTGVDQFIMDVFNRDYCRDYGHEFPVRFGSNPTTHIAFAYKDCCFSLSRTFDYLPPDKIRISKGVIDRNGRTNKEMLKDEHPRVKLAYESYYFLKDALWEFVEEAKSNGSEKQLGVVEFEDFSLRDQLSGQN